MTDTDVTTPVVGEADTLRAYLRTEQSRLSDANAILEVKRDSIDAQIIDLTKATKAINAALDMLETNGKMSIDGNERGA